MTAFVPSTKTQQIVGNTQEFAQAAFFADTKQIIQQVKIDAGFVTLTAPPLGLANPLLRGDAPVFTTNLGDVARLSFHGKAFLHRVSVQLNIGINTASVTADYKLLVPFRFNQPPETLDRVTLNSRSWDLVIPVTVPRLQQPQAASIDVYGEWHAPGDIIRPKITDLYPYFQNSELWWVPIGVPISSANWTSLAVTGYITAEFSPL